MVSVLISFSRQELPQSKRNRGGSRLKVKLSCCCTAETVVESGG